MSVDLSVIVPVSERYDDVRSLYAAYSEQIKKLNQSYEFVYVLDGEFPEVLEELKQLQAEDEPIKVVTLATWFGEATALSAGFEYSAGETILTLPAYLQIEPAEIPRLLEKLSECDMAIGRRSPRIDSWVNRTQARAFHGILNWLARTSFQDLGCGARAFSRRVIEEISVYGDQHRFLPLIASRRGFKVCEVPLRQSEAERSARLYRPGVYLRRILDILTVFFVTKFTKKPLRFFGLVGSGLLFVGGMVLVYLVAERLFVGGALAERPALLLASLLVVLGIQVLAIGLIGELIIFAHAREMKEYTVGEIVDRSTWQAELTEGATDGSGDTARPDCRPGTGSGPVGRTERSEIGSE